MDNVAKGQGRSVINVLKKLGSAPPKQYIQQIYQNTDGSLQLSVPLQHESLWLSQSQMAQLFDTSTDNISLHLKNVFSSGELDETATTEDFSVVRQEGKRQVKRRLKHYNLDAIISVGYRVNSVNATKFRQWATQTLKQHLLQGFTLNQQRLQHNAQELDKALQLVKRAAALPVNSEFGAGLVDIIASYTQTFLWLQQYDEGLLETPTGQPDDTLTPMGDVKAAIAALKKQLMEKGEATKLFANEREDGLSSIWGTLEQSVFGEPAYPTIESKVAHFRNLYARLREIPRSGPKRLRTLIPNKSKEQRALRCSFRYFTHEKVFCGILRTIISY